MAATGFHTVQGVYRVRVSLDNSYEYGGGNYSEDQLRNPRSNEEILAALNHDVKSSEWILTSLHRQWYESIFWSLGEQYMEWNQRTRRFQVRPARQYIPRSVTNYILPKVEIGVSLFMDSMPRPKFVSQTKEQKDRGAAQVANGIIRYRDEEEQIERKKHDIAAWTVGPGTCYAQAIEDKANAETIRRPIFTRTVEPLVDEATGMPIMGPDDQPVTVEKEVPVIDPETKEQAYDEIVMADEGVEVISPFEIIPDWSARYPWEFRTYTHFRARTRDWIGRVYGSAAKKKVKADKGMGILGYYQLKVLDIITRSSATGRLGLPTAYGGSAADWRFMEDAAVVISRWQLPNSDHEKGRLMVIAGSEVLEDEPYPYGDRLNLYTFRWSVLPGSIFGFGMVRNLIPIQKRLNGLDTQNDLIRKTMGNPGWLSPKGNQFSVSLGTSEPGHVYQYKNKPPNPPPQRLDGKAAPAYNAGQRLEMLTDMEEVSGVKHILGGSSPPGVTAGVSLELLTEQAGRRFKPAIDDNREEWKRLYLHRMKIAQESNAWAFPRPVPIVGENGDREVRDWEAADFKGPLTVEVEAVPITAFSHTLKTQRALEAMDRGLIDMTSPGNREKLRQLLNLGEFEEEANLHIKRAEEENQKFVAGMQVLRGSIDNDEIHIQVHSRLILSDKWDTLPEAIKQAVMLHLDEEHIPRLLHDQPPPEQQNLAAGGKPGQRTATTKPTPPNGGAPSSQTHRPVAGPGELVPAKMPGAPGVVQ